MYVCGYIRRGYYGCVVGYSLVQLYILRLVLASAVAFLVQGIQPIKFGIVITLSLILKHVHPTKLW